MANKFNKDQIAEDAVNDTHIDWGTGANQVSLDDIPDGSTSKLGQDCSATGNPTFASITGGNVTSGADPGHTHSAYLTAETDPVYSANTYATGMNQGVATTDSPSFINATLSGKTAGSVLFAGAGGVISQDNSNLFYDSFYGKLGLGISPGVAAAQKLNMYYSGVTPVGYGMISSEVDSYWNETFFSTYSSGDPLHHSSFNCSRSRGTKASKSAVMSGDNIGYFNFRGYDGTDFQQRASFGAQVDGAVSSGTVPLCLRFLTGTSVNTERMRITSTGKVGINNISPQAQIHAVQTAETNVHYDQYAVGVFESTEGRLQVIADDAGNDAAVIMLTNAPAAGNNNHWGIAQRGATRSNKFEIGYVSSASSGGNIITGDFAIFTMTTTGRAGFQQNTPTAYLHLGAGTATAATAPLKFTSGTLLGTPEAGAVEFLTDKYYGTITTGAARKEIALSEGLTSGRVVTSTTNGRLTDSANLTYDGSYLKSNGYKSSDGSAGVSGTVAGSTFKDGLLTTAVSGVKLTVSTADVSNPPTDAELDGAFGTPATVGSGFIGIVNDNNAGTAEYLCWSDGTNWWYQGGTKAT